MARLLIRALRLAGHTVELASELRTYLPRNDPELLASHRKAASAETARIIASNNPADLWFTYHPYYKSPDLVGPEVSKALGIPYVTAEASYSTRRTDGAWGDAQDCVAEAISRAATNICMTRRDADGLREGVAYARIALLPPFIDTAGFSPPDFDARDPARLVCVAMMRPGDKLASYRMLAAALHTIADRPWTLSIVGDGPCADEVGSLFSGFGSERVRLHGRLERPHVAAVLGGAALYVWPGCGEAYGLAYLEAQAMGLPVVAQDTAGVPEVVRHGATGLLAPAGDADAFAAAIVTVLDDGDLRRRFATNAPRVVAAEHALESAARRLANLLPQAVDA